MKKILKTYKGVIVLYMVVFLGVLSVNQTYKDAEVIVQSETITLNS